MKLKTTPARTAVEKTSATKTHTSRVLKIPASMLISGMLIPAPPMTSAITAGGTVDTATATTTGIVDGIAITTVPAGGESVVASSLGRFGSVPKITS